MNRILKTSKYILLIVLAASSGVAVAQRDTTLTQEVEVVKAYKPTISDANKISGMPRIEDAEHEKPSFNYSIFSQPIYNTFSVNTLKAATFESSEEEDSGLGLVRAGVGNYNKPYAELFFNNQRTKNTLFGLHGKHLSSHGKLNLEGGDRVDAPFSDNQAEMFLKHMYRSSVLSVNLGFKHNGFNYYGYPVVPIPEQLKQDDQELNYLGSRQTFTKGSFNIGLENATVGNNDFKFDFDFLYHYFGTKTGQREHFGEFMTKMRKPLDKGTGFLEAGISYTQATEISDQYMTTFGRNQITPGKNSQTWITLKPSYFIGGDIANVQLGANAWIVSNSSSDMMLRVAPNIRANLVPAEEIIRIFAGIDGNLTQNNYSKIAYENPFVDPEHLVKNTFERIRFFGGFDGKFSRRTNFKLSVDYSIIKDQPLYYLFRHGNFSETDLATSVVDNDFDILYDNLDRLKFNLEIFHAAFNKMNLLLSANYYVYKMETMDEAWNMPDWDAKFSLAYQVSDQLSLSSDLFFTGQRKALIMGIPGDDKRPLANNELPPDETLQMESYNLSTVFDLNFNANYKISNQFSVFAQLNNFGFQKYQRWLGYPVQSFNVLGGISYAF
ncbi:hypothetical protein SAMN05444274_104346 [Mariniphaga anaerophila]|uniref:TonB dependent receptor n=1 Tax=Mariniphaga anaerophila TaxID=1484053 RepID=A0A1M5AJ45_9BACT|nr:hypothetical protein [Mariniphaga anaerophila]SHF30154.1 hypothetical protein SAMN05444274_104346 [Mariniphaga anaerophila]